MQVRPTARFGVLALRIDEDDPPLACPWLVSLLLVEVEAEGLVREPLPREFDALGVGGLLALTIGEHDFLTTGRDHEHFVILQVPIAQDRHRGHRGVEHEGVRALLTLVFTALAVAAFVLGPFAADVVERLQQSVDVIGGVELTVGRLGTTVAGADLLHQVEVTLGRLPGQAHAEERHRSHTQLIGQAALTTHARGCALLRTLTFLIGVQGVLRIVGAIDRIAVLIGCTVDIECAVGEEHDPLTGVGVLLLAFSQLTTRAIEAKPVIGSLTVLPVGESTHLTKDAIGGLTIELSEFRRVLVTIRKACQRNIDLDVGSVCAASQTLEQELGSTNTRCFLVGGLQTRRGVDEHDQVTALAAVQALHEVVGRRRGVRGTLGTDPQCADQSQRCHQEPSEAQSQSSTERPCSTEQVRSTDRTLGHRISGQTSTRPHPGPHQRRPTQKAIRRAGTITATKQTMLVTMCRGRTQPGLE